jgi:hypothetical protein
MPSFEVVWVDYAGEQFDSLPPAARRAVMDTVAELQDDPIGRGSYDQATDRYTADFVGDGAAGLLVYVVGQSQ